jgi:ADP-heptose:LPS heptosyltransferase
VVNYHTKRRTNAACFLAGIPVRLGYRNDKFGFLLNRPVADRRHLGEKHEAEYCLDLLKEIGVVSSDLTLEVAAPPDAEAWADQFFAEHGLSDKTVVALHPDASDASKCWPAPLFGELAERLADEFSAKILFVGGMTAQPTVHEIDQKMHHDYHDLTGSLSLGQLASLFRRCRLLVSNDSGPVHVAAAVGTPVISLFLRVQPGINPARWRPLGERSVVIASRKGEEIVLDKEGSVAGGKFDSITVDEVFGKARDLLRSTPRAH